MTKCSPSFQRSIIRSILRALICFMLLGSCVARNPLFNLDLNTQTLNPLITGFKITGNVDYDQLGYSVSTTGDINNDGYDDIIVGAYQKNGFQGAAYVIYGGAKSTISNWDFSSGATLNPLTTGFTITGNAYTDFFGYSVSAAGDVNNDGYDDIIVGAPYKNGYQGAAYVIYGGVKTSMSNIVLSSTALNPTLTGFMITANAANDFLGYSVSTAGDINNDGYDDIIVGAPYKNSHQGAAYVIYGGDKTTMSNIVLSSTTLDPTSTGFKITGSTTNNYLGNAVSAAGDVNNDGYDDIIIGASHKNNNQGAVYVIYGGPKSSMSNWDFSSGATLNPTSTGFMITGDAAYASLGWSVSTAGDVNNDGYDDIIIGASGMNMAYVIYGGEKSSMSNIALISTTLNPTSTGFTIKGAGGSSASKAGDVNNDGYDDIIVGTSSYNGQQGAAYVIYGGAKSTMSNVVLSSTALNPTSTGFMIIGGNAGDNFGYSVSTAGDINNDGYSDLIVGAMAHNTSRGAAYVIYASCSNNCKQCSSESVCIQCKEPYHLYKSECLASCPDATMATSTTCEDCPAHCNICSSTSVCTQCKNSYILYKSQCFGSCPGGTFAITPTSCTDCPAHCNHCTSTSICTECFSPFVLYQSQCLTSCPKEMFASNNVCKDCPAYCSSCISQEICQICYEGYLLSNSRCVFSSFSYSSYSSSQGAQEKALKIVSSATKGVGSVVCVGSAVFPFSALVSKTVQNTRYLNLSVTSDLAGVYKTWQTDLISWDVPNGMSDLDHFEASPSLFAQYDLSSPFLLNFWPTLLNIGIGFGTFIACILLQKFCEHRKYEGWAYSLMQKLVAGSFNFALVQAYACLDDILFYLVLDAKTNPFNSSFSRASLICAITFLVLGCLLVFFNFWTVKKYQNIKKQGRKDLIDTFNERNKYWELFYSDFNDGDLWSQSFFATLIIRSALSSLVITVLYDFPMMQTSSLVILDGVIILFLYFKNPFNTLRGKFAQYYYEIITFLVHICTLILSLQDTFEKSSDTVRLIMSTGILYLNTALVFGALGFMFIEIYKIISEKIRAARLKQYENIAVQTTAEDMSQEQSLYSETQRTLETSANRKQTSSYENLHLLPRDSRKSNFYFSGLNMETSQIRKLKSNLDIDSSRELEIDQSSMVNQQRDQNPALVYNRRKLRMFKPRQQKD